MADRDTSAGSCLSQHWQKKKVSRRQVFPKNGKVRVVREKPDTCREWKCQQKGIAQVLSQPTSFGYTLSQKIWLLGSEYFPIRTRLSFRRRLSSQVVIILEWIVVIIDADLLCALKSSIWLCLRFSGSENWIIIETSTASARETLFQLCSLSAIEGSSDNIQGVDVHEARFNQIVMIFIFQWVFVQCRAPWTPTKHESPGLIKSDVFWHEIPRELWKWILSAPGELSSAVEKHQ